MKLIKLIAIGAVFACYSSYGVTATNWWLNCGSGTLRCANDTEISQSDGVTATVTAWGDSDNGDYERRSLWDFGSSGLGSGQSEGESSPEHGFDNDGVHEFAFISFDMSVELESIMLGYYSQDADISVLAYTGNNFDVNTKLAGLSDTELVGAGWEIISNFDYDSIANTGEFASINNTNNVSSQYWLVGAYNSAFSSAGCNISNYCQDSGYYDYFKLKKLKGTHTPPPPPPPPPGVPAPATAALFGLGLLLLRSRSKRLQSS